MRESDAVDAMHNCPLVDSDGPAASLKQPELERINLIKVHHTQAAVHSCIDDFSP